MRVEIKSAANFLTNLLRVKCNCNSNVLQNSVQQLELFCNKLEDMLCVHYQKHWFPEKPFKGSGYRCIRINHKMDPIISRAGSEVGFDEASLRQLFPDELTMWIDPREVSYRIGENGSICVLFDGASSPSHTRWVERTPPRSVRIPVSHRVSNNSDDSSSSSCDSPMSMSPPSPSFDRSSCKDNNWDSFIMDPHNINYELAFVSS